MIPGTNEKTTTMLTHDYLRLRAQAQRSKSRKRAIRDVNKAYMVLKAEHLALKARTERMQSDLSLYQMREAMNRTPTMELV